MTLAAVLCCAMATNMFTACTGDLKGITAEVVLPKDVNLLELEQYSYAIPFEINSDSEWEIDFDFGEGRDICYVYPSSGTGSAVVKICVLDNWTDERREGEMYVTFPEDESKNQVIKLRQKCNLDNDDNLTEVTEGDRIYAVGYGYNYLGEYASANSVSRCPLIKIEANEDKVHLGPVDASFEAKTYSGSSITSLMNELNTDAKFSGKYFGFKGEVGATFSMKDFSSNNYEYAISYVEVAMQNIYLEMNAQEIIDKYMTDEAYEAINGLPHKGRRGKVTPTTYPATADGFKALVQDYGTHLIVNARLGGKLKYRMRVDISKVEGSYDLKAYANCSYKNKYVKASANVSDSLHSSYQNNSKACEVKLLVQGGDKTAANKLTMSDGDNDANIDTWRASLKNVKNQTLVGLDVNSGLIPLYDLVDRSLTLAEDGVDGEKRYKYLKAYLTGEDLPSEDFDLEAASAAILKIDMNYETGVAAHIASIPTFDGNVKTNTLIKDINIGGQNVAQVCEEYIPVIDKTKRVRVIYPVISNKVKYNMGYFVGDAAHKPAKVCWEGTSLSVTECSDEPIGAKTELYVRGSSFTTSSSDDTVESTTSDYTMAAPGRDGAYNYPLVKIFNQIWMRENYVANHTTTGDPISCKYNTDGLWMVAFYTYAEAIKSKFTPQGWRVSAKNDFLSIQNILNANNVTTISTAKAFFPDANGGVLGFYHWNCGWCASGSFVDGGWNGYYGCLKPDANKSYDGVFMIGSKENFEAPANFSWDETQRFPVRLVHDIE